MSTHYVSPFILIKRTIAVGKSRQKGLIKFVFIQKYHSYIRMWYEQHHESRRQLTLYVVLFLMSLKSLRKFIHTCDK